MTEELDRKIQIREKLDEFFEVDVTHDELGIANGFHDANESINRTCEYVRKLMGDLDQWEEGVNSSILDESYDQIMGALDNLKTRSEQIESLIANGQGVNDQGFPAQRNKFINAILQQEKQLKKQLHPFELQLNQNRIDSLVSKDKYFEQAEAEAAKNKKKIEEVAASVQKTLDALQKKTTQQGVDESASHFGALYDHHKDYERNWLVVFGLTSIGLAVAVWYALSFDTSSELGISELLDFLKRLVVISIPSIFLKVSLTKYNTERNLRIIYSHRQKVLDQYKTFEAGIGDDTEAKNQFRLEIAKYIFSDPNSGYISDANHSATEVNINPIMSAVEKLGGR